MVSFEDNANPRDWKPDLSDFFDDAKDGSPRVADFIHKVEIVKGLLADARQLASMTVTVADPVLTNDSVSDDDPVPANASVSSNDPGLVNEEQPDLYSAED